MICFENDGLIELDTLRLMGVSVKSEGAIGYFGTGLKFAVATLLRTGHAITIQAGRDTYPITVEPLTVRGASFEGVRLGDERLGFTTQLGKNWEPWQAFRELHSNALDEGGDSYRIEQEPVPHENKTRILVSGTGVEEAFDERDIIFLPKDLEPIIEDFSLQFFDRPSSFLYYRGVRVHSLGNRSLFTWNIKHVSSGARPVLTEDRTLDSHAQLVARIQGAEALVQLSNAEIAARTVTAKGSFEFEDLPWHTVDYPSKEWLEGVGSVVRKHEVPEGVMKIFVRNDLKNRSGEAPAETDDTEEKAIQEALTLLNTGLRCPLKREDVTVVEVLMNGALGQCSGPLSDKKIYISRECVAQGRRRIASTLFEEWMHRDVGLEDYTRRFQDYLLDRLIAAVDK